MREEEVVESAEVLLLVSLSVLLNTVCIAVVVDIVDG